MKKNLLILLLLSTLLFGCVSQSQLVKKNLEIVDEDYLLENQLENLTSQIVKNLQKKNKTKIAVIEFSDLNGNVTNFGKYLSEELITRLFVTENFVVIERNLLNKVIKEQELGISGFIDDDTAVSLGKILGVDAIASGSITDLGSFLKINARLISAENGSVFAVASVKIKKDNIVNKLIGQNSSPKQIISINDNHKNSSLKNETEQNSKENFIFQEDFSKYEEGDITDWGNNVYIKKLKDGRKYLVTSKRGRHTVGQNIDFPKNFFFQFDFSEWAEISNISFVDTEGKKYTIKWKSNGNRFILPDGSQNHSRIEGDKTVRINVKDNVVKCYINGKFAVSGPIKGFTEFKRFEVDVSYNNGWHIFVTNFKIGYL